MTAARTAGAGNRLMNSWDGVGRGGGRGRGCYPVGSRNTPKHLRLWKLEIRAGLVDHKPENILLSLL